MEVWAPAHIQGWDTPAGLPRIPPTPLTVASYPGPCEAQEELVFNHSRVGGCRGTSGSEPPGRRAPADLAERIRHRRGQKAPTEEAAGHAGTRRRGLSSGACPCLVVRTGCCCRVPARPLQLRCSPGAPRSHPGHHRAGGTGIGWEASSCPATDLTPGGPELPCTSAEHAELQPSGVPAPSRGPE